MNSLKTCLLYLCILLTLKVKDTLAVYCSYYDTTANQIRTNFCPQSCCLTAPSIEESCCYSWTWLIILVAFGFPILVGFILMIALCLFYRKRRIGMPYPGGLVMYVDPRRFPATSQHMFQMPMPPPQYNAADMLGVGIENNTTSTTSSGEPPAYTSISESQPPSSSKTTATVAATISNNNNHQAALKSESSGTILSVRSRHESGSHKSKQPVVEASVDTVIPNPASSTPAVALDEIKPSAEIEPSSASSSAPRNSTSDAKDDIEIVCCVDNQNSVLDGQKTKEEKK